MSFIKVTDPRKREELIKDFIETRKRIKDNFVARKVGETEYQTGLTKLFKPITETQKATAKEITEAQKATAEKLTSALLPIKEGLESITVIPPIEEGEAQPALKMTEKELIEYGPTAVKYLKQKLEHGANIDKTKASLYSEGNNLKIGYKPVKIEGDDIFISDERFKGTAGLWKLLIEKNIPEKGEYKAEDLMTYIIIMHITKAAYDKNNKRISGNYKMNNLIKPLVKALEKGGGDKLIKEINKHFGLEEEAYEDEDPQPSTSGTGLKILPNDPNALIDRFDLLFTSQKAGHTGVRNEIVSILDELKRQGVINSNTYKKLNSIIKK